MASLWHFLTVNGIGQNVTASALLGIPAYAWAHFRVLPKIRRHAQHVAELHAHHLPHLHQED